MELINTSKEKCCSKRPYVLVCGVCEKEQNWITLDEVKKAIDTGKNPVCTKCSDYIKKELGLVDNRIKVESTNIDLV